MPTNRHHGGQEPPDSKQDRPEQNAGYDAIVRGQSPGAPTSEPADDMEIDPLVAGPGVDRIAPDSKIERVDTDPDARAEREAAAEVRRRESRNR